MMLIIWFYIDITFHFVGDEQYFSLAPDPMESSVNSNFSLASGRSGSTVTSKIKNMHTPYHMHFVDWL